MDESADTENVVPFVDRIRSEKTVEGLIDPLLLVARLKTMAAHRVLRRSFFEAEFAIDPVWDVLIELAIAEIEGRTLTSSQLITANVGASERWLSLLVDLGYCEWPADGTIRFTRKGSDEMVRYLAAAGVGQAPKG